MTTTKTHQLAANSINGVYICENPSVGVYIDMDFYSQLDSCGPETIYGLVSHEVAEKIESEYGIR